MKKDILDRYDVTVDGKIIIKVSACKVEDLYNDFDQKSSFLKKDLHEEVVDYIIESVDEIGEQKFVVRFYFEDKIDIELQDRITNSIKQYFSYLEELEKKLTKEQIKNSLIFMAIGIFFTALSILLADESKSVVQKIISEGLMVAGWVSLWEALATFLIKWLPLVKKLKLYKKISNSTVEFELDIEE